MNFRQFIRWRLVCFVQTHIRHCQECLGSNGHCQECNDWHHLFRRDWQRTYWRLKVDQKTSSNTKWNPETGRCDKLVVVTIRCNKCHTRGPTVSMYAGWYDRPAQVLNNAAIEAWNQRIEKEATNDASI